MKMKNDIFPKIVECYKDYLKDQLISLVLFGSWARAEEREGSDLDIFLVCNSLPESPLRRTQFVRRPLLGKFEQRISIIAKTKEEVEKNFPPLFLDLGLDGKILYDHDFFQEKQKLIRQIIKSAGLKRLRLNSEFYWKWEKPPKRGWTIDWTGFHEL
ncbi:MAG: nucleotidyltransferase domain-containing protein [Candidatus Edwardsbacteria bacterium]